jgi:histidinol phosphatase-like PHP family hydrolase
VRQTPSNILRQAAGLGLETIGFADHVWVNPELAPSGWYRPQDAGQIEKLRNDLAATETPLRVLVGCEAETIAPGRFGMTPAFAESLDYVLLACSHFHMTEFVEQPISRTPRAVAEHLLRFFRSAVQSGLADIIPHPFYPKGFLDLYDAAIAAIPDAEFLEVFGLAAERRVAMEISAAFFPPSQGCFPDGPEFSLDTPMRVLQLARQAGCRFSLGSDSHRPEEMNSLPRLKYFLDKLSLTQKDLWLDRGRLR